MRKPHIAHAFIVSPLGYNARSPPCGLDDVGDVARPASKQEPTLVSSRTWHSPRECLKKNTFFLRRNYRRHRNRALSQQLSGLTARHNLTITTTHCSKQLARASPAVAVTSVPDSRVRDIWWHQHVQLEGDSRCAGTSCRDCEKRRKKKRAVVICSAHTNAARSSSSWTYCIRTAWPPSGRMYCVAPIYYILGSWKYFPEMDSVM